ncbi:VacJ family lipoprotein [uncultured Thioclava sp.]|uniref:MlaA family lipoprotein n=1 Tax=uncultured Thioclava sp. TaxID=473858 RepID=UPI0025FB8918|nr:VacJ family lipoprotein [uncultured Thioclava sp.]
MTGTTTQRLGIRTLGIATLILSMAAGLAGCGPAPRGSGINDPYEASNRQTHAFNKKADSVLFRAPSSDDTRPPVGPVGHAIGNVGNNLGLPSMVLNSLLQGRPEPAIKNTFRFIINSTLGLGGIFDPAGTRFSLPESTTDFGETLHVWGVGEGTYLELPIFGPSTERDALGKVVDLVIDPLNALDPDPRLVAKAFRLGARVETRKKYSATVDSVLHDSADSYAQSRLLYLQNRRFELNGEERNDAAAYDPYDDPALQ